MNKNTHRTALFAFLAILLAGMLLTGCPGDKIIVMDNQGHRGCRGNYPENTLEGFFKAVELGATTLELDVVISADKQVVVSHEPWLNAEICLDPKGNKILPAQERSFNLFRMPYDSIKACDCGSLGNPNFPEQVKVKEYKPLLSEVLLATATMSTIPGPDLRYNIEIKREEQDDSLFYPPVPEFVELVLQVVFDAGVEERVTLQSFDLAVVRELHTQSPDLNIALLVDEHEDYKDKIGELGFYPSTISPWFKLVDERMMSFAAEKNMKVIPWTVNEEADMQKMINLRVDGIITDFPGRLSRLLNVDLGGS